MSTEHRLSYTASDIDRRLGKVDEIDSLKNLVGETPVADQIAEALNNVVAETETDTTLSEEGKAADAKATGEMILSVAELANEAKNMAGAKVPQTRTINGKTLDVDISLTAEDIGAITEDDVAAQIAEAIVEVYVQDEEPTDAATGTIWVDTDEDGKPAVQETPTTTVHVVDARTEDYTTVDFSQFAVGDVVVVTIA